jgi:hypothetical protein
MDRSHKTSVIYFFWILVTTLFITMSCCTLFAATEVPVIISASAAASCKISVKTNPSFANYDSFSSTGALATGGSVDIKCNRDDLPAVWLSPTGGFGILRGSGGGAGPSDTFAYTVVEPAKDSNAAGAPCPTAYGGTPFPTTSANAFKLIKAPNSRARTYNICFQAAPGQDVRAGNYIGTATIYVEF